MKLHVICRFLILIFLASSGCARFSALTKPVSYQVVKAPKFRNPKRASSKNQLGLYLWDKDKLLEAEQAFQQALIADSTYGPAHNNLGKLHYEKGDYYLAATEFDCAARAMPNCPQPPNNIGLIYDRVENYDEAIRYFTQAHETCPTDAEYLGNLIRARIARGDRTSDVREQLEYLRMIENRPEWEQWAAEQLATGQIDAPFDDFSDGMMYESHRQQGEQHELDSPQTLPQDAVIQTFSDGTLIPVEPIGEASPGETQAWLGHGHELLSPINLPLELNGPPPAQLYTPSMDDKN